MDRRGFLKGLGISTVAVAVPSIVSSQSSLPTFKSNGLYDVNEMSIYEDKITTLINLFCEKVEIAWNVKDVSILPTNMISSYTNELSKIYGYTLRDNDIPIDDSILDKGFICGIKYELLKGDYRQSRQFLSSWKHAWGYMLTESQRKQFNNTYIKLCTEVGLENRIKTLY